MQSLTTLKSKGQESFNRLLETGRQQPPEVQLWGIVAASAIVGGIAVAATAKGLLAILGTLASPPVALTIGALGGGALGWSFMQSQNPEATEQLATAPIAADLTATTI